MQRPLKPLMADAPSKEELVSAIGNKMKNGKEGGSSGILAEMVKEVSSEDEFLDVWLDLVHELLWKESFGLVVCCAIIIVHIERKP